MEGEKITFSFDYLLNSTALTIIEMKFEVRLRLSKDEKIMGGLGCLWGIRGLSIAATVPFNPTTLIRF